MARRRTKKPGGSYSLWRSVALVEGLEPRLVLSAPPLPVITGPTFLITNYGAVGDGVTNNTTAIQNCINTASLTAINEANTHSSLTGAVVEIPAAASPFESGPITVPSNIDLQIDSGGTLQALQMSSYPNESSPSNFIGFKNASNVEITGSGRIDGNGAAWWTAFNSNSNTNRPFLIDFSGVNTLLVQGVTISNSPMFHMAFSGTNNVTINGVTVSAPSTSPNTDGIDPSGQNYLIENCNISTGDDDIAIKPQSTFCANITITMCTIGSGHGISVGGETNDGLNGLNVNNTTFNGTTSGIRLKAGRTTGGLVQNCTYSNLTMTNVQYPINISSYYPNTIPPNVDYTDPAQTVTSTTPIWENITFSTITSTNTNSNSQIGVIWGLPEEPVNIVTMIDVKISAHLGMDIDHAHGVTFDSNCKLTAASGPDIIGDSATTQPLDAIVTESGWVDQDIGSPATAGDSLWDPDTQDWTINGSGTGIGGTLDKFNLASIAISGNAVLSARVNSQTNTNAGAQAGVMIRETNSSSAAFAEAVVTPTSGVEFEWRNADGATAQSVTVTGKAAPLYVMVLRQGSSFSGYYSSTGANGSWTQIGSTQTITMNSAALEGLAVSANATTGVSTAVFTNVNTGPTITAAAAANPNPVTGLTTGLSVQATTALGTALSYNWSDTGPGSVLFSANNSGTALNTTATFSQAGAYSFTVTVTDTDGLIATSTVGVNVNQTLTSIALTPLSAALNENGTQQFTATADDQFGLPLANQPAISYSVEAGSAGGINSSGLYTAPDAPGSATVQANVGTLFSAGSTVTITNAAPTVAIPAAADVNPVTGTTTDLSVLGADDGGESNLTYTWSVVGPAAVNYSDNGDNTAKNTTATFTEAGQYQFTVTITDSGGLSTTSQTTVNVDQTPAAVNVSPPSVATSTNTTEQFTASATDQFGNPIASPSFNWMITGSDNSIDDTGLATLGPTPGDYTLTAALGTVQGTADVTTIAAPAVSSFTVNDGNPQRSMITSLTVLFSEPVNLGSGAITLGLRPTGGGPDTPETFTLSNPSGDQQTYILTFTDLSYIGGSLPDGVYDLVVTAAQVTNSVGATLSGGDQTFSFYRLYGDYFGTGSVGFADLVLLAQDFGVTSSSPKYLSYMDVDDEGSIGFAALVKLAQNFGASLSVSSATTPAFAPAANPPAAAPPAAAVPLQTFTVANNYASTAPSVASTTAATMDNSSDLLASPPITLLS
jgi:polygalacturonase